jgi:protein-disulfide isomerase
MRLQIMTAAAALMALTACSGQGSVKAPDSVDGLTKAQVEAIVKEYLMREPIVLAEAFNELQRREEEQKVASTENAYKQISISPHDPVLGRADAPITIVEFTDYNCGYCKLATSWVMSQVDDRRGDVRVIVKESAVRGSNSEMAAAAALAATKQGKYREMHLALMKVPANAYTPEIIDQVGKSVGMDVARMRTDMNSKEVREAVKASISDYEKVGLEGTPSFFINGTYVGGFGEQHLNDIVKQARDKVKT